MTPRSIAPTWHTVLLVTVLLASAWTLARGGGPRPSTRFGVTLLVSVFTEATLTLYVVGGLRSVRRGLRVLWGRSKRCGTMIFWGIAFATVMLAFSYLWHRCLPGQEDRSLSPMPPVASPKIALLAAVAIVAVGEEFIFRGYLQRQFEAWRMRFYPAALAQAALFAGAHLDQGLSSAFCVGLLGLFLSIVVRAKGGLGIVVVAHAAFDGALAIG